jgi:hypothetical protein
MYGKVVESSGTYGFCLYWLFVIFAFFGDGRHQKSSHVFFLPLVVMYCTVYSIKALYDCCYMFLYIGSG